VKKSEEAQHFQTALRRQMIGSAPAVSGGGMKRIQRNGPSGSTSRKAIASSIKSSSLFSMPTIPPEQISIAAARAFLIRGEPVLESVWSCKWKNGRLRRIQLWFTRSTADFEPLGWPSFIKPSEQQKSEWELLLDGGGTARQSRRFRDPARLRAADHEMQ